MRWYGGDRSGGWVVMAIFEAAPAMLCNEKVAGVATLGLLATTENVPAVVLAVKVVAVASRWRWWSQ